MPIGWTIVLIICLIIVGSALYNGFNSAGGFIIMILFAPLLIPIGILGIVAAVKVVKGESLPVQVYTPYSMQYASPPPGYTVTTVKL